MAHVKDPYTKLFPSEVAWRPEGRAVSRPLLDFPSNSTHTIAIRLLPRFTRHVASVVESMILLAGENGIKVMLGVKL